MRKAIESIIIDDWFMKFEEAFLYITGKKLAYDNFDGWSKFNWIEEYNVKCKKALEADFFEDAILNDTPLDMWIRTENDEMYYAKGRVSEYERDNTPTRVRELGIDINKIKEIEQTL